MRELLTQVLDGVLYLTMLCLILWGFFTVVIG